MFLEDRFRYLILFVGCACLTSISSNMLAFNIAQVCMSTNDTNEMDNKIKLEFGLADDGSFDYTPYQISLINWAVALGTACAAIPFSELYVRFGAKWPFFAAGMLSSLATLLMPLSAEFNFYALLAFRFLQGVSYAADFAAVGSLCSSWASLKQNGFFLGVLTSYSPLSSGFTNFIGGFICESRFGWPLIFYVHAAFGFIVFTAWFFLYLDKPHIHKKVSTTELEKIQRGKNDSQINGSKSIPYKVLFLDLVVISIWFSAFAEIFSTNFLAVYSPYYLKNVLKFSAEQTGNFAAISRIVQIPIRLICGHLSDSIQSMSEDLKLVVFNTITVGGAGIIYALIGYVPEDSPLLAVACFAMVNVVTGAASGGFYKCAVLYARQYSNTVIATCQLLKCATLFIGPLLVAIFVHDSSSQSEWRWIFLITAVALFMASAMFCKFATSTPAAYTHDDYVLKEKPSRRSIKVSAVDNGALPQKYTDLV